MIDLHYWTTPNGHKITIALEELGLEYRIVPVNISAGDQFRPAFLRISPNNRIPAIVDHDPPGGGAPLSVFESGAILEYLADKTGRLLAKATRPRFVALQWLYWQMSGLGPMAGQNHHFAHYAPERIEYATRRYVDETSRLYRVLDNQLAGQDYVAGAFSIADIACYPWIRLYARQGQDLRDFPHIARWFEQLSARPAFIDAYRIAESVNTTPTVTDEARRFLFGQRADSAHRAGSGT
ncbi:thiol:disulfide oxidoreductase [Paraburkholderia sp. Se-20369]|nr:thiol:disulfide oxidoreductase [Paraburkholderia sp. Se-20369]TCW79811.1 thiol:disulfide oxidoreductase [Burkholderia sp. SRS-46]